MIKRLLLALAVVFAVASAPVTASEWEFISAQSTGADEGSDLARINKQGHVAGVALDLQANRWMLAISIWPFDQDGQVKFEVLKKGEVFSREIPGAKRSVDPSPIEGHDMLFFWLEDAELELLMSGNELRIAAGSGRYAFPLKGSRKAISQLVNKLGPFRAALEDDRRHSAGQSKSDCDQQAAHPWDERRMVEEGVKWGDLYADVAVASCREAVAHSNGQERIQMLYQLGRALDKAGDPEAFRVLFEAGENYGHPMALNHLAILYWDGDYTDKDLGQAEKFFRMSHLRGSIVGKYNLARFYINEHADNISKTEEAYSLLSSAAYEGYPQAQELLGKEIMAEKVPGRVNIEALYFLEEASNAGRGGASMALAEIYRDGTLVGADPKQYLKFLRRAAEQGNQAAKEELGID
ncbi:TPR repeat protein [Shimia isoporae]|uniref:TPR repeat protein n=1 Tax=Shimia isoporae TaxID=647720 RepID=A0A4R1N8V1_9RHOB|nr:tetratricopeptide repeat protein [Shimia isoporae]TCK99990.1 TPR repeat protein [Shimia isoporae]